jgi:hypothetical protein
MTKSAIVLCSEIPIAHVASRKSIPPLMPHETADLIFCFIKDLRDKLISIPKTDLFISYTPRRCKIYLKGLFKDSKLLLQHKKKMGNKIFEIYSNLNKRGYRRIIIIAADSPDLPRYYVERALKFLETKHKIIVIGPCADHGFYLIALNFLMKRNILADIDWGQKKIIKKVMGIVKKNDFTLKVLPLWYDVDNFKSLLDLTKRLVTFSSARQTKNYLFKRPHSTNRYSLS